MKLPNKITTLNESVIGKSIKILDIISKQDLSVLELFEKTNKCFSSFDEFIDALDYLFAINMISLIDNRSEIHYVK